MTNTENDIKKEIYDQAYKSQLLNLMLITQCETWLSAEEGNENMVEKIKARCARDKRIKG